MTKTVLKGSCLCGDISYQITGEPTALYHCHCERCRKANGTDHASNIRISDSSLTWLTGEDKISSYKLPEAERFRNDFCNQCGSPLPRNFPALGFIVLPAGTLDTQPPELEACQIFYSSKASWRCKDSLPSFDGYPDK